MAQHIPMDKIDNKVLKERARKIKANKFMPVGSLLWQIIEKNRYLYVRGLRVPQSLVCGGYADMEIETNDDLTIKEVYLVS